MQLKSQYIEIDATQISIEQIQQFIEVKNKWEKLIQEGKIVREKEILEYYKNDIPDDTKENKQKRKDITKKILKARRKNYSF